MTFQVILRSELRVEVEDLAEEMADTFGIPLAKAAALLRRAPGPLTKPIGEREAVRVAYRLRRMGLDVEVVPLDHPADRETDPVNAGRGSDANGANGANGGTAAGEQGGKTRSPFLSQVDERPSPVPGLDETPPGSAAAPSMEGEQMSPVGARSPALVMEREAEPPHAPPPSAASPGSGRTSNRHAAPSIGGGHGAPADAAPEPMADPLARTRADGREESAARTALSPLRRHMREALLAPAAAGLVAVALVLALVAPPTSPSAAVSAAAASAASLQAMLGGRDPSGEGASAEMQEALLGARGALRAEGMALALVADPAARPLAGWTEEAGAGDAPGPEATGLSEIVARAGGSTMPVTGTIEADGRRYAAAASAIRFEGQPVAVVVTATEAAGVIARGWFALFAGMAASVLAALVVWWRARWSLSEYERLEAELARISRGDLERPVSPGTAAFQESVQALERVRVSLLEGLERLRRRRRAG